jgi:hypothetical protein
MLGAIGVVFGDIGTSPLYAFRESFVGHHRLPTDPFHVLGVLSMLIWTLILVVTVKYVFVTMRADNRGEGGSFALLALIERVAGSSRDFPFIVQHEPTNAADPVTLGLFASIGIKKGKPFAPDERMKRLLAEGVAIGNAAARSISFANRDKGVYYYPDRQWFSSFAGAYDFIDNGALDSDKRVMWLYNATGVTPAMSTPQVGTGSVYPTVARDSKGNYLDGGNIYSVTLPAPVPVNNFWAFTVYDGQTRGLLETDQKSAGIDSNSKSIKANADGSYTVYFGPKALAGKSDNWVQTMSGKSYFVFLRLYGPLNPWFDKTWRPGDFEPVE